MAEASNFRELDDAYMAIPRHGGTALGVVPALLENQCNGVIDRNCYALL